MRSFNITDTESWDQENYPFFFKANKEKWSLINTKGVAPDSGRVTRGSIFTLWETLHKACFHPDLWMAAMSVRGSNLFQRAYWLQGSRDAGEDPSLQSLCASLTWGSGARTHRPTHAHIHTYWQHTEATLPKRRVFGLWGKRQGICQMCTCSFRSVPPTIRCYWGYWGWSAWLRVVYRRTLPLGWASWWKHI